MKNLPNMHQTSSKKPDQGFAILLVVFIISLATIIVTAFSAETFSFLKRSRAASDSIAADYAALSALEIALGVLEIQDDPSSTQQPWQILNSMSVLPLEGFNGEVRVQVIDQDSLINVNAIIETAAQSTGTAAGTTAPIGGDTLPNGSATNSPADSLRSALVNLFNELSYSSFGSNGSSSAQYSTEQQIAVLADFIDQDTTPFSDDNFPAQGIEGPNTSDQYLNRPLQLIDELGRVPGISKSFLQNAARYLRVSSINDNKINVNTAPPAVLKSLGFQDNEINGILDKRQVQLLTPQELEILVPPSNSLSKSITTNSNNYKVLVRAKTVSTVRWLEADCFVQTGFGKKIAVVKTSRTL